MPAETAVPQLAPFASLAWQVLSFVARPAAHHIPPPQSVSDLHTQVPLVPSMLLQPLVIIVLAAPVNGEPIRMETFAYATAVLAAVVIGQRMRVQRR